MSRDASITLPWATGDFKFRLGWGELAQLQEACDAGPFVVFERLGGADWRVQDISSVIRLGLVGGGTAPTESLVRDYVESRPPMENLMFARGILAIALQGAPDEKPGEQKRARRKRPPGSTISPKEKSA